MVITGYSQTFNTKPLIALPNLSTARGTYGTYVGIGYVPANNCTIVTGTVTPVASGHADTLFSPATGIVGYGTDTGYAQLVYRSKVDKTFDFTVTAISGTLAGTAILQGSYDNTVWYTLTGNTTYCTTCKGASATLSGSGTTDYQWYIPDNAENYPYHQVRAILSGTCTATFNLNTTVSY